MGVFKDAVEPLAVVVAFTLTTLVNRRSQHSPRAGNALDETLPLLKGGTPRRSVNGLGSCLSILLDYFPFLIEIYYWLLTYWSYQLARAITARIIAGNNQIFETSRTHALQLLHIEHAIHMDIERRFQIIVLRTNPWLMKIFSFVYQAHIVVGILFLGYTYTFVPAAVFQRIRRSIAINNWIAFIILSLWRCMPPRFLDGYQDVLHSGHQSVWAENKYRLTIAAMPSLHFGTSAFIGWCMWKYSPHRALKTVAPIYPVLMLSTILATANHWVLDAVVGVWVVFIGYHVQWILLYLLPLEDTIFNFARIQKPIRTDPTDSSSYEPYS